MNDTAVPTALDEEIRQFVEGRKSLQLATITEQGAPYASYAPFALCEHGFYVQLSDIAIHAKNLKANPLASILVIEDELTSEQLFARVRVNYSAEAVLLEHDSPEWEDGVQALQARHGQLPRNLSKLQDFNLFKLCVVEGRYVKGFGKAFSFSGPSLSGSELNHLRDGHKPRAK